MLIASLLEPQTGRVGDYWYSLDLRAIFEYVQPSTARPVMPLWNPVLSAAAAIAAAGVFTSPTPPTIVPNAQGVFQGVIWIDSNDPNHVPHLFDLSANAWISVIPKNYIFPPQLPPQGTCWHDSLSGFDFAYTGTNWVMLGASTGSGQITGSQNVQPVPVGSSGVAGQPQLTGQITAPNVSSGGAVGNLQITNTAPIAAIPRGSALSIVGLVDIYMDGTIVYGPNYTPDKTAEAMWDAIAQFSPIYKENQRIKALEDISKELAREVQKYIDAGFKLPEPKKPIDPNDAWNAAMGVII